MSNANSYQDKPFYEATTTNLYSVGETLDWGANENAKKYFESFMVKFYFGERGLGKDDNSYSIDEENFRKKDIVGEPQSEPSFYKEAQALELIKSKSNFIQEFEGKYVAMKNGNIIDSDADYSKLVSRVFRNFPSQESIYITRVVEGERVAHFDTPLL